MNIVIYLIATCIGLGLSYMGFIFALLGGVKFAYIIGGLLIVSHVCAFVFVAKKAAQGKGLQSAIVLVSPIFIVCSVMYLFLFAMYVVSYFDRPSPAPALPEPVDAINPKFPIPISKKVKLEILENKDYAPVMLIENDESAGPSKFTQLTWDEKRYQACHSLLKPVENRGYSQNQMWRTFVNDPTGKKFISNRNSNLICEANAIWLMDYAAEKNNVVIVKASISGNVIYRVSFDKPDESFGYSGFILPPTLKSQDGYVYFDWWTAENDNKYWKVKRSMKVRFPEPVN